MLECGTAVTRSAVAGRISAMSLPLWPSTASKRAREMYEKMAAFIVGHGIHPVIDSTGHADEIRNVLRRLEQGTHFGKLVVTWPGVLQLSAGSAASASARACS